ncbi:hypothetical protein PUNSTDRAFT_134135 [Punctularia strigosozonata HHB-11173 SS5]|uniref:uncharacterized protein n=1 Tax=Punctularia strigosozonata (strain HHB-11173) TaxID=741275 RepID=UPI0004416AC6|nr:uncharacterized protein PUNSTDRAFT_134135 [Punctularia strigosozonata HHB-11173 SS5]EIN08962.1 hypothetical protein PUNSTDRAFT_134135 [Punctularia strigosozonata HHB-11173 SS5]
MPTTPDETQLSDAERVYKKSFLAFAVEHRRALKRLPPWMCDEYLREDDCPRFHYGLGVSLDQFRAYGIKYKLFTPREAKSDMLVVCQVRRIVDLISKRGKVKAKLRYAIIQHYRYTRMIAFYTNFNKYKEEMASNEEAKVVKLLKSELNIPSDSQPLWYWDSANSSTLPEDPPKAVKLHMQVTQTQDEDQKPVFEDVDPETQAKCASYGSKPE